MLRTLLAKDLRRAWRNPLPWVIQLIMPIVITAIIGGIFSPRTNQGGLGQIRIALVDEDDTWLTGILRQTLGPEGNELNMKVETLTRTEALRRVDSNKLAAAVIVPKGFTDGYVNLTPVNIELVKNPAEVLHPSVVEEYLVTLTTGLNALARVAGPDFAMWRREIEKSDDFDLVAALLLLSDTASRMVPARDYLRPPLVGSTTEQPPAKPAADGATPARAESPAAGIFRFLLIGLGAMFMLLIADNAGRDLYREMRGLTLARYRTMRTELFPFIAGKAVFTITMVLLGAVVLWGGGGFAFQFAWHHLLAVCVLLGAYALFAAGLVSCIAGLAGSEQRAAMFNNIFVMMLAIGGGCMFPLEGVKFWREHIAPWVPTHWFAGTVRALQQSGGDAVVWADDAVKLAVGGVLCLALAAVLFRRRLEQGVRA